MKAHFILYAQRYDPVLDDGVARARERWSILLEESEEQKAIRLRKADFFQHDADEIGRDLVEYCRESNGRWPDL